MEAKRCQRDDELGDANLTEPTSTRAKAQKAEAPAVDNGMYGRAPRAGAETLVKPKGRAYGDDAVAVVPGGKFGASKGNG